MKKSNCLIKRTLKNSRSKIFCLWMKAFLSDQQIFSQKLFTQKALSLLREEIYSNSILIKKIHNLLVYLVRDSPIWLQCSLDSALEIEFFWKKGLGLKICIGNLIKDIYNIYQKILLFEHKIAALIEGTLQRENWTSQS